MTYLYQIPNDGTFLKLGDQKVIKRRYIVSAQIVGSESDHVVEITDTLGRVHKLPQHYPTRKSALLPWAEAEQVLQEIVDAGDGIREDAIADSRNLLGGSSKQTVPGYEDV